MRFGQTSQAAVRAFAAGNCISAPYMDTSRLSTLSFVQYCVYGNETAATRCNRLIMHCSLLTQTLLPNELGNAPQLEWVLKHYLVLRFDAAAILSSGDAIIQKFQLQTDFGG